MKTPFKVLAVIATVLAIISLNVRMSHAFKGHGKSGFYGWHMKKMFQELNLSEEQKQEIKGIFKEKRSEIQPIHKQLITERRALRDLVQAETLDESAIRLQAAKLAPLNADLAVLRAQLHSAIRGVLTPEQLEKFKELQEEKERKVDKALSHGDAKDIEKE